MRARALTLVRSTLTRLGTASAASLVATILVLPATAQSEGGGSAQEKGERWTQAELETLSKKIMKDLEEVRGEKYLRPVAVKVSSKADLIEYIKARENKTTPPEQFAADELAAKMLGVIPPELDLRAKMYALLEAQVGGFYDPDTDSFSLMEWVPRGLTKIILAHELDHALDDQLFDIDGTIAKLGNRTDPMLAYHAVVEGSGTAIMTQWMMKYGDPADMQSVTESQMKDYMSMADAPDWLWKPMVATYMVGAGFLGKSSNWMMAGAKPLDPAALRTSFTNPPRSTEQVLHPDKYWKEGERDEPRSVKIDTAKLGKGWSVLREETMGEIAIGILTTPPARRNITDFSNPMAVLGIQFTNDVSAGWGGDSYVLLGNGESRILRWVTVWDGERDAGEFYGAMQQQLPVLEAAAKTLSGKDAEGDGGATVEYGEAPNQVVLTVHVKTGRSDLKRALRDVKHEIQ